MEKLESYFIFDKNRLSRITVVCLSFASHFGYGEYALLMVPNKNETARQVS